MAGMLLRAGFDPLRLRYVPNGVPVEAGDISGPLPGRCVYAGRLSPEKGVETLVHAASSVEGLELVVCGSGPLAPRLEALAAAAPAGRIQLRGHLDAAALQREITAAAFVAVPSEWFENAPFAALEAMAEGRAVLASGLGGLPELVQDGVTGMLLPPGEVESWTAGLRAAVGAPQHMQALGVRARALAHARFGLAAHVAAVESVYHEVHR